MGRVVFIILLFCSLSLSAQQTMSFVELDTTTYQQYLKGDWKALIKSGKEGMDQGISYYYLQMRIAYAHYMREEYRAAIKHYKNALEFNSSDLTANKFLYYSYLYSGRSNDALVQIKALTADQKESMNLADSSIIVSIGVNYSYATSDATSIHEDITEFTPTVSGVQKTSNYFHLPGLDISNRIGNHVILNHSISYLQKNEFSYASNSGLYLSPEQIITQMEYGLSVEIAPGEGCLIRPGLNFLSLTIPIFSTGDYGPSAGRDRSAYDYVNLKNRVLSLMLSKEFRFFNAGLSYVNNDFNEMKSHQAGLHSTVYPLSNLNLYYSLDLYYQHLMFGNESQDNFILHHSLGFKIFKNLWMEISNTLPEQMNFYNIRNDISYNSIEKIGSAYSASIVVPVYKAGLKLFGNFGYNSNNSYFFPDQDLLNPVNKHSYNNFIITGGIKWTK